MRDQIKYMSRRGTVPIARPDVTEDEMPNLLTPARVAEMLSVSIDMVYKLVREGDLEAIHIGRLLWFPDWSQLFLRSR